MLLQIVANVGIHSHRSLTLCPKGILLTFLELSICVICRLLDPIKFPSIFHGSLNRDPASILCATSIVLSMHSGIPVSARLDEHSVRLLLRGCALTFVLKVVVLALLDKHLLTSLVLYHGPLLIFVESNG